jgi:hypothetical protein
VFDCDRFSFFAFADARVVEFGEGHRGGYFVLVVENQYVGAGLDGIDPKRLLSKAIQLVGDWTRPPFDRVDKMDRGELVPASSGKGTV